MVLPLKKIKIFYLPLLFTVLFGFEADAQLLYNNNTTETLLSEQIKENSSFAGKPRRGFTKRRYGRHTFFLEGGLFGGYYTGKRYSINYDLLAQSGESNALTIRVGYGQNEASNDSTYKGDERFLPLGINILIGRTNHFEIGFGGYYYMERGIINPYVSLGFRHQHPKGGIFYRIALDMHLERVIDTQGKEIQKTAVFGPVIGLGWTF